MSDSPAKYPSNVLDSVLSEDGPMPAARLGIRLQAFLFDWIFISFFAAILVRMTLSHFYPEAIEEYNRWGADFTDWIAQNGFSKNIPMPSWSDSFERIMNLALFFVFNIFWLYFGICDVFFSGYTFGKRICRLRTVNVINMKKPFFASAVARGGLKAFALLSPLILLATVAALKFNKRRQMGHDLLCRTAVIDERYLSSVDQIR